MRADAYAFSGKIGRSEHTLRAVVRQAGMRRKSHHHGRQQQYRLAMGQCLQIGNDGQFGNVVVAAHHFFERGLRQFDVIEVKNQSPGGDTAQT